MKKSRYLLITILLLMTTLVFASQMQVVAEVFSSTG